MCNDNVFSNYNSKGSSSARKALRRRRHFKTSNKPCFIRYRNSQRVFGVKKGYFAHWFLFRASTPAGFISQRTGLFYKIFLRAARLLVIKKQKRMYLRSAKWPALLRASFLLHGITPLFSSLVVSASDSASLFRSASHTPVFTPINYSFV